MTSGTSNPDETQDAGAAQQPEPEQAASDQQDAQAGPADKRVVELESQIADLTDRLLRAHAEMDNVRKRAERERLDTAKYAITKFANDIVAVSDNFQRAVTAVPPGAAEQDAALKSLIDGVLMTERAFLKALETHGVKRVDPTGEIFNPHFHQAVMEQQNPEVASGTVMQVLQAGYVIEDRVLRPAMVAVAKGGPKPPKFAENGTQGANDDVPDGSNASKNGGADEPDS